jgi:hypothetical protein
MATQPGSWVVYLKTLHGHPDGVRAICAQHEWEQMEQANPGYHKFIQGGIATEREAELLARGTTGDPPSRLKKSR